MNPALLLDVGCTAARMCLPTKTVEALIAAGDLPVVVVAGHPRVRASDLADYVAALRPAVPVPA